MKLLPLVLRNLTRSKRRSIMTVLSIAVSVFVFASLISLPGLMDQILRDRANSLRLIAHSKAGPLYQLPEAFRRQIEGVPHVDAVAGYSIFMGSYRDPKIVIPAVAIDPDRVREIFPDWGISARAADEFKRMQTACFVGTVLMDRFGWKIGSRIIIHGTMYPKDLELTIAGMIGDRAPEGAILFRRDYLEELLGRPGTVNIFWVKVDRSQSVSTVIADIDRMFANSAHETTTETEVAVIKIRIGSLGLLVNGARLLAAIVIFTIGLVAANTAAMAVRERRHEIGVMRAIGFTRRAVVGGILVEGLVIGVAGGTLGCALARAGFIALPYAGGALGPLMMQLKLSPRVIANSFIVAAVIGAASAWIPAVLATRHDIASELRAI